MAENKNTHSQPKKKTGGNQSAPKVVETNASQNVANEFALLLKGLNIIYKKNMAEKRK